MVCYLNCIVIWTTGHSQAWNILEWSLYSTFHFMLFTSLFCEMSNTSRLTSCLFLSFINESYFVTHTHTHTHTHTYLHGYIVVLGYGLDDRGSRARFPAGAGNFSLHRVQNGSVAHPASYPMGTRGSFPGGKAAGREADHSPPTCAEVKECVELYLHSPIPLHSVVLS
jgi:hypothetical protein